mmetsp:Transcript_10678/g.17825  ORF Transcript_10678/g.17825 Transcript_10678/m.17825 type:complete len:227 (+) Transcript_10678:70-750(+)|eukprot:CAMPEP_0168590728 /NCGR_PEP_ID=MMETSP0420-20121227/6727_1 /TAXON_ID=498008 /ORGANISM="Pessonella sp." /LENGTH=226 /DNA_ID=CAMNT_0008626415 /DNA_START=42 /DNA_END=722 /DNA_ORIENTATION=-
MKHNNAIPRNHFKKDWQNRVKTWFDQPARKQRRRVNRAKKAARVFPRPVAGLLRPLVQAPTKKYNAKTRLGRGFTLEELKAAGVSRYQARSIGIAVDHRRKNRSQESLQRNADRLAEYKNKLVLFPRKAGKAKKGTFVNDASKEELEGVTQLTSADVLPVPTTETTVEFRAITDEEKNQSAFATLRRQRNWVKKVGVRQKLAEKRAEAKKEAKKDSKKGKKGKGKK